MPNAKVLSEKQAIVAALTEKLQNAAAGVIVDYKGITVAEDTAPFVFPFPTKAGLLLGPDVVTGVRTPVRGTMNFRRTHVAAK